MAVEIKVPSMGESITEATVGAILKESGAVVEVDEEIIELETDKVNQVLYAPASGKVTLNVGVDDVVKIGDVIGNVDGAAAPVPTPKAAGEAPPEPVKAEEPVKAPEPEPAKAPTPAPSSHNARVMEAQFLQGIGSKQEEAPTRVQKPGGPRETKHRMSKIRRVIAQRLLEAQATTAMLTTFNEVDLTEVMALRGKYKDGFLKKYDVKLGFMSFFVKAAVSALKAFPLVNSYIDGDHIMERNYYDIGIAVGTDRGLFVPVVRDCDKLSFADIEGSIIDYAMKARDGKIGADDLRGGGFTITNGGVYGSLLSTPILNPPQSAILGMHTIQKRPMAIGDNVVVRPMMYLALSYDHRIIDGKEAVSFLVHIKDALEDPSRLLIGI